VLFGDEHVEAYRESDGEVGHEWKPGIFTLLLTTTGRRSGTARTVPLIYIEDGDAYVVIASKGGADTHPAWYLNLEADPEVELQVGAEVMRATARRASGEEETRLWERMAEVWPDYDEYAKKTDRPIPVVVLTPRA
jgi:deazaflavin-dependent oxidoreductase (nitroreductase family)